MDTRSYLDIDQVYTKILERLVLSNKSVAYLSQDDPYNLLIGLIALYSVISSTYVAKIIDNKYVRYPLIDEKSNLNVLENFGIRPRPVIPSSITLTLEYTAGLLNSSAEIPYNTKFTVLDDEFVTFEPFYLLPFNNYAVVTAYKGIIHEEEFSISDIVNQKIELAYKNVVEGKVVVSVDDEEYTYTDYCLYKRGSYLFGLEYEYPDTFYISFPINYTDTILSYSRINVRYLTADDTIAYDPTQETVNLASGIYNEEGTNLGNSFEIYNVESFSYGDKRHTTDFCYKNLGRLLSTFGKAVTTEDYKILTDYYPGVAVSAAYDLNSERRMDPYIYIQIPYYTKIVVAPTENYFPNEFLKKELYAYYDKVGVDRNQVYIQIIDPRYRTVDLSVMIHTKYLTPTEVLDSYNLIYESVRDFFRVGNLEFGSTITENILMSVVISSDTKLLYSEEVEFKDFKTVFCEADELPLLGRLSITFNYEKLHKKDFMAIMTDPYTLEREYPVEINFDDGQEVGPLVYDMAYFSDMIYKDSALSTDITIIRMTNLISNDQFSCNANNSSASDSSETAAIE